MVGERAGLPRCGYPDAVTPAARGAAPALRRAMKSHFCRLKPAPAVPAARRDGRDPARVCGAGRHRDCPAGVAQSPVPASPAGGAPRPGPAFPAERLSGHEHPWDFRGRKKKKSRSRLPAIREKFGNTATAGSERGRYAEMRAGLRSSEQPGRAGARRGRRYGSAGAQSAQFRCGTDLLPSALWPP